MVAEAPEYLVGGANAGAMPRDRRVDFWREHVTANHGALRFAFSDPRDFHGGTRVQRAGPVQLVDFWSDAIGYERRSADIERDGDASLRIVVPTSGQVVVDAAGRRSHVRPGDAALVTMTQPFDLSHDANTRAFILSVPSTAWPEARPLEGVRLWSTREGAGAIFATMVAEVAQQAAALDRISFLAATKSAFELFVRGEAGRADRLMDQAQALVRRGCADQCYDPAELSRELGMSLRAVQQRLSQEGRLAGRLDPRQPARAGCGATHPSRVAPPDHQRRRVRQRIRIAHRVQCRLPRRIRTHALRAPARRLK